MAPHFFLCSAAPELSVEERPAIDFDSFIFMLELSCSKSEWRLVSSLRQFFDIMNLQAALFQQPLRKYGTIAPSDFDDHLQRGVGFSDFVIDYLARFGDEADRRAHFGELLSKFFEEKKRTKGFVGEYFTWFEEFTLVCAVIRARRIGRDIGREIGTFNPLAMDSEIPESFFGIKEIYERDFEDPGALEKNMTNYIFQHLEAIKERGPFSLDYLLAYMLQLISIEHLQQGTEESFDFEKLVS